MNFQYFKEKYNLSAIFYEWRNGDFSYEIINLKDKSSIIKIFGNSTSGTFDCYEKAELDCLEKLIEITKNK